MICQVLFMLQNTIISQKTPSFPTRRHDRSIMVVFTGLQILVLRICTLFATAGKILTVSRKSSLAGQAMYLELLTITCGCRIECLATSSSMVATHASLNDATNYQITPPSQTKWSKNFLTEGEHWKKRLR